MIAIDSSVLIDLLGEDAMADAAEACVRDALGLTKGTQLKVELDGGRIILRKNVDDAISRARGRFKLPPGMTTDDVMRELRGRAPGDPTDA